MTFVPALFVAWLLAQAASSPPESLVSAAGRAATVAAPLDSVELSRRALVVAVFRGDATGMSEASRSEARALAALDSLAASGDFPGAWRAFDWPSRQRWFARAAEDRRMDWARSALDLDDADLFPPAGFPSRGSMALAVAVNAEQALAAAAPPERARLDALIARALRTATESPPFRLRDEAFFREWRRAVAAGDTARALAAADSLVAAAPRSLRAPLVRVTRARAYLAQGDPSRAIEEARLAQPVGDSAELRWVLVDALLASGRPIEAAAELEGIVGKFGADTSAVRAYERRLEMSGAQPDLYLTTEGRVSIARFLLVQPESGALAWMIAVTDSSGLPEIVRVNAGLAVADYLYRAKRYGEAESLLTRLRRLASGAERDRAVFLLARVYRNTGRPEPMEPLYRELMRGNGALAPEAAWDLAREYESLGRWSHARAVHGILIDRHPGYSHHRDALFRRGFAEVRLGMLGEAAEHFRGAFAESREAADREQAAFWLARTLDASGRHAEARDAASAGAIQREPVDYYGVRLRERYGLPSEGPPPPEKIPLNPDVSWESVAAGADWPDPVREQFLRGAELARLGILDAARREWQRTADLARDLPFVFETLAFAAAVHHVYPEGVRWANRAQSLLPYGFPTRTGYDRLGAPAAYYGAVSRAAGAAGVEPDLVWAIMRQESLYDPLAVSRADARGLLQILPSTLSRIDRGEGRSEPRPVAELFRPEVNIPLGVRFFADRLREFGGNVLPALAGYNAGEGKAREWIARADGNVEEVFVECIGYPETHGYVRRIVWLAWVYRAYYARLESSPATGRIAR